MKNYSIYLDDIRTPKTAAPFGTWKIFRSTESTITYIKENDYPKAISFDHDLGMNCLSGFDFAKWLIETDLEFDWMNEPIWFNVHLANPIGAKNIEGILTSYIKFKFC